MSTSERELLLLLKERSFSEGNFHLASGDTSNYYIDGKMTEVFSAGAHLIGEVIYDRTKHLAFDAIGGLEVGAVPLTTAAVISYHQHGEEREGFWVRDKVKNHGTQKPIEGKLCKGSRVVIVDDVVTKGTSILKAVDEVQKLQCKVLLVLSLVDRLRGAGKLFKDRGIEYQAIFTIRDFGINADVPREVGVAAV